MTLLNQVLGIFCQQALTQAFQRWQAWSSRCKAEAQMMAMIITATQRRGLKAAFRQWKEQLEESRRADRMMRGASLRLVQRRLSRAFMLWLEYAALQESERRRSKRAAKAFAVRKLGVAFNSWYQQIATRMERQALTRRALTFARLFSPCITVGVDVVAGWHSEESPIDPSRGHFSSGSTKRPQCGRKRL